MDHIKILKFQNHTKEHAGILGHCRNIKLNL